MGVVFSPTTAIGKQQAAASSEAAACLVGAVLLEREKGYQPIYEQIGHDRLSELLEHEDPVFGSTVDEIEGQLEAKYPCNRPDGSHLLYVKDYQYQYLHTLTKEEREKNYSYNKGKATEWRHREVAGWMLLDRPLLDDPTDIADVKAASIALGPVLIYDREFEDLFKDIEHANLQHFTAVERNYAGHTFHQVNFNPGLIRYKQHNAVRRQVAHRFRAEFPTPVLFSLYAHIYPSEWPDDSRHITNHIRGRDLVERRGWGFQKRRDYTVSSVLEVLDLGLKLFPDKTWWRDYTSRCDHEHWKTLLAAAFLNIHAVEKECRNQYAKMKLKVIEAHARQLWSFNRYQSLKQEYLATLAWEDEGGGQLPELEVCMTRYRRQEYTKKELKDPANYYTANTLHRNQPQWWADFVTRWREDEYGSFYANEHPGTLEQFTTEELAKQWKASDWCDTMRLCRWLRREGKACGVTMPAPPQWPKPPSWKKKRKRVKRHANSNRQAQASAAGKP